MLIDNRHGGPIHIPTRADSVPAPGISGGSRRCLGASHEAGRGTKLPPRAPGHPADPRSRWSSPRRSREPARSSRASSTARPAPFLSHEDGAVRKAALEQDDLIKSRTGG